MATVIITGGTGMVGTLLSKMLIDRGDKVIILTTQKKLSHPNAQIQYVYWQPSQQLIDLNFGIDSCSIINLAGAGVADKRWSPARKIEIRDSRVMSLQTLYQAIATKQIKANKVVSASAIGYYAPSMGILHETAPADQHFLSETCVLWEQEALKLLALQVQTAIARIGIVLSQDGGALKAFLNSFNFGVAGIPGDGKQMVSWVHIEDICRLLLYLLDTPTQGIYNAVADIPVSTNELFVELLKYKKGIKVHIPTWVIKLMLGEMSTEILKSAHVSNLKIREQGFSFHYKNIDEAIKNLLG